MFPLHVTGLEQCSVSKGTSLMAFLRLTATAVAIFLLISCTGSRARFEPVPHQPDMKWFKGNTHTHTTRSDGDSEPEEVARWYKDHGYDFLVLTDHNVLTNPAEAGTKDESFLLIPGEEVSAVFRTPFEKAKPIHVNALGTDRVIEPANETGSVKESLRENLRAIREANALPHVNHPNFRWAISHEDLLATDGFNLLEIHNGHPLVNNAGDSTHPAMEVVWDILLSSGRRVYGIGVDDAHHFKGEFLPKRSNPGRAWVVVRSPSLTENAILGSLEAGNFYFSTGVVLDDIRTTGKRYEVTARGRVWTEFIGVDGTILAETTSNPASYKIRGNEKYVRAKVHGADGGVAWTQPVFLEAR